MKINIKLNVQNFAKIERAEIEFKGITVICGDNDSGKSTVGKILFSIFDTNIDILSKIRNDLSNSIRRMILSYRDFINYNILSRRNINDILLQRNINDISLRKNTKDIVNQVEDLLTNINYPDIPEKDEMLNKIKEFLPLPKNKNKSDILDDLYLKIYDKIKTPYNDLLKTLNNISFNNIFNSQINNLYNPNSTASVGLDGTKFNISFKDNKCTDLNLGFTVENNIFYIENPFIIDSINGNYDCNIMNETLLDALQKRPSEKNNIFDVYENNEILDNIKNIFDEIHLGDIIENNNDFYIKYNNDVNMKFETLSTGIKSFLIIKILLENTSLKKKDILILDEPEIHLHPAWQLKYAEMIVLLQKYLDLTIIINTHSYYFLEAINQYSRKHKIKDNVNFYLSKLNEDGKNSIIEDVTYNLENIYSKMYEPMKILESLEFENDE